MRWLIIGYGNPGREDDGLGPALAEAIGALGLPHVRVDSDYQLVVEDAAAVAEVDAVIFADADVSAPAPFYFKPIEPALELSFSSHSVLPEVVLGMAHELFGAKTRGYVLGIRGESFEPFAEGMTDEARARLEAATRFIQALLTSPIDQTRPWAEVGEAP
ncbi:hydrogenase maturation protease [Myxococcota bacterium]|nr:hydrogenase maturation protease [Myxococcota bacterium]MBU1431920.1 hydrogenase maturation protease [Myxococcota bacterium]MBU1900430.1 hydrogenase maturation protease [Myxococcota bacterium]